MAFVYQGLRASPVFKDRENYSPESFPQGKLLAQLPARIFNSIMGTGVGIEVEVEKVKAIQPVGWLSVKEGSLRDAGSEWVTKIGLRVEGAYKSLCQFKEETRPYPDNFKFTERTSIHIHLDCSTFSLAQVQGLMLLFTLVENPLFNFAGPHRKHGVFSVPFRESIINFQGYTPKRMIETWSKYSALNLKTLQEYGTVEFRIMEGNMDVDRISTWIYILALLHDAARRMTFRQIKTIIDEISGNSYYREALKKIFYGFVDLLYWSDADMDQATIDARMLLEQMEI